MNTKPNNGKNLITSSLSYLVTSSKPAFTFAEILIAMLIVGVICLVTIGILKNSIPTKEESVHKKINSLVEQIVSRLIDNEVMYPETADKTIVGFQNTNKVTIDGETYGGNGDDGDDEENERKTKFCKLFAAQFTTATDVNCVADERTFSTADGVDWFLPVTDFSNGYAMIMIDVNGKSEGNNCLEGACKDPDRFVYYVRANGTVTTKKPNEYDETTYAVHLTVENREGGKYSIGEYKSEGTIFGAEFTDESHTFSGLKNSTIYILKATPSSEYTNKWEEKDSSRYDLEYPFVINGADKNIKLIFTPKSKYCIILQVTRCYEDSLWACINTPVVKNKESGATVSMNDIGKPVLNASGGYDALKTDATRYMAFVCGLTSGSYEFSLTTNSGYQISNGATSYTKNVPLGSENQTLQLILEKQSDDPCKDIPNTTYDPTTGKCLCNITGSEPVGGFCMIEPITYAYSGDVLWYLTCEIQDPGACIIDEVDPDPENNNNTTNEFEDDFATCPTTKTANGTLYGVSSTFRDTTWDSTHQDAIAIKALTALNERSDEIYQCPKRARSCTCTVELTYTNIKINDESTSESYNLGSYDYNP